MAVGNKQSTGGEHVDLCMELCRRRSATPSSASSYPSVDHQSNGSVRCFGGFMNVGGRELLGMAMKSAIAADSGSIIQLEQRGGEGGTFPPG